MSGLVEGSMVPALGPQELHRERVNESRLYRTFTKAELIGFLRAEVLKQAGVRQYSTRETAAEIEIFADLPDAMPVRVVVQEDGY